jgi:hypothetical protein
MERLCLLKVTLLFYLGSEWRWASLFIAALFGEPGGGLIYLGV